VAGAAEEEVTLVDVVMAGHSRPKDGVASARLCPAIQVLILPKQRKDVDARDKHGHDGILD
jgi:hypothetical protein